MTKKGTFFLRARLKATLQCLFLPQSPKPLLRLIHLALVLLTVLSYLAPLVDPEQFWPVATLGLLVPWLWLSVLFFGVYWLVKRRRSVWLSLVTLLLGWDAMSVIVAVPDGTPTAKESWSIVSLNCHSFEEGGERLSADAAADRVAALDADVLCLQEYWHGRAAGELTRQIVQKAGFEHYYHDQDGGIALFSRFALKDAQTNFFANRANGFLRVDVEPPEGWVRLYNIHLQTNAISGMADQVTTDGKIDDKNTWLTIKDMFGRYGRASKARVEQARDILDEMDGSPYPVVLVGDFNDVPASFLYRLFSRQFKDAFHQQGRGLGATYRGRLPGLRIDYIFHDPYFEASSFERIPLQFSDHWAIRTTLAVPE